MNIREIEEKKLDLILRLSKLKENFIYVAPILVNNELTGFKVHSERTEFLGKLDKFPPEVGSEIFDMISYVLSLVEDDIEILKPIREDGYVRGKSHVAGYFRLLSIITDETKRLVIQSLRKQLLDLKIKKGIIVVPRSFRNIYDNTVLTTSLELFKFDQKEKKILKQKILTKPLSDLQDILDEASNDVSLHYKKFEGYDEDLLEMIRLVLEKNNLGDPERVLSLLDLEEILEMLYNKSLIYFLSLCA